MKFALKSALRVGASVVAMAPAALYAQSSTGAGAALPGPTIQNGAPVTPPAPQEPGAASPTPTSAPSNGTGLEEIVVTAQRRSQNLQSVPIAVTSVTAAMAQRQGITGTESLTAAVPSLVFSRQTGNGGTPFIRGVGSTSATPGASSPVAVYVDDVYIGVPSASTFSFNSIDQIDVLKGPQGTLFGRNATGGVVQIRTRRPTEDTTVDGQIGFGNYNTLDGSIYGSTGLTDTLAVNVAATGHDQIDGYGKDVNTGDDVYKEKYYSARTEALWKPDSATSLLLIADYNKYIGDAGLNVTVLPGSVAAGGVTFPGRYRTSNVPPDLSRVKQYGFSGRLDHDFDAFRFVSISSWRKTNNAWHIDNDSRVADVLAVQDVIAARSLSQEFQILSPKENKLQWIGGFFYYDENTGHDPEYLIGSSEGAFGGRETLYTTQKQQSVAGFGEANYEIVKNTKLTIGLRYTMDMYQFDANAFSLNGTEHTGYPLPHSTSDFSKLTYRAVLDHHFTSDIMAYASYSRGFKSGGYNASPPTTVTANGVVTVPAIAPEVLDAYEVGLKTELFDRKLRLNVAAFYYDYKNMQVTIIGSGTSQTLNAAEAHIKGIDADFSVAPFPHFVVSGGATYLDGHFAKFDNGPILVPNPASCATLSTTGIRTGGNTTCSGNLAGYRTPRSPKFTGSVNGTYTWPAEIGDIALTGTFYHNSGYTWDPDGRIRQPVYNLLGATLSWTAPSKHWEVRVWAKNLTNSYYFTYESAAALRDAGSPAAPRTFGGTVGFHF